MRAGQRLVGAVVLAIAGSLAPGCWGFGARAMRRAARNPDPSRDMTSTEGCVVDFTVDGTTAVWSEHAKLMRWDTATASVPTTLVGATDPRGIAIHGTSL